MSPYLAFKAITDDAYQAPGAALGMVQVLLHLPFSTG